MNSIELAISYVRACEQKIRTLIDKALDARRYDEIPELAALAAQIADATSPLKQVLPPLEHDPHQADKKERPTEQTAIEANAVSMPMASSGRKRRPAYPRFERVGEKLSKVGWSKKDKSEYEHKTSMTTARTVVEALANASGRGAYVRIEDLLPVFDTAKQEVPSYQIYLVVAWLRDLGAMERFGNDGYRWTGEDLDFSTIWENTAERK